MNNPYISAILAITSISFGEEAVFLNTPKNEYVSVEKPHTTKYKSDKKNCDLCVNDPKKKITTQV